jgi:hypothetical protein
MKRDSILNLLLVAGVAIVYKFIRNLIRFCRTKFLLIEYERCLRDECPGMVQHEDEVVKLFELAGISDSVVPHVQELGRGRAAAGNVSVFKNLTVPRQDIAGIVTKCFHRALGIYWKRMWNAFNPLYWIELLLNLPKESLAYLGTSPEGTVVKAAQLLYWFLGALAAFFLAVFPSEINALVKSLFGH